MKLVGCIIGDSFVEGLHRHLSHEQRHRGLITAYQVAFKLKLQDLLHKLHLFGIGGARINKNFVSKLAFLGDTKPNFLIINLGTNDLATGVSPLDAAVKLVDLAKELLNDYKSIKHISLCSAIDREGKLQVNNETFASLIYNFNGYLKNLCDVEPHIDYHIHKGFWAEPITLWSRDGIHPNNAQGRSKYKKSLRRAVFIAITRVKAKKT